MRTIFTCLILVLALPAFAEPDEAFEGQQIVWPVFEDAPADAPTARIGFVFDQVSRRREAAISVGEPVEVLLVAWDIQVALMAWEAGISIDERLSVIETEYFADLHLELEGGTIATLKTKNCSGSSELVLARFKLLLLEDANDLVLGLGPATPSTRLTVETDAPYPAPIYQVCREDKDIRPFLFSETSAVLNPVSVHPDPVEGEKPRFLPESARGRQ